MATLRAFSGDTDIFLVCRAPRHQKQTIFTGQVEQFSSVAATQIEVTYFVVSAEMYPPLETSCLDQTVI